MTTHEEEEEEEGEEGEEEKEEKDKDNWGEEKEQENENNTSPHPQPQSDTSTVTPSPPPPTLLYDKEDVKQDIDMIINELVRPLLPHVIIYVLKRKAPYIDLFSPLIDINRMIEEGINDGLHYARHILYNEKRAKLIKVINYLIKKYNTNTNTNDNK